jgi:hypothetical protein
LSKAIPTALGVVFLGYFIVLGSAWVAFTFVDQVGGGHALAALGWALPEIVLIASAPLVRAAVLRARPSWRRPALLIGMTTAATIGFVLYVAAFVLASAGPDVLR